MNQTQTNQAPTSPWAGAYKSMIQMNRRANRAEYAIGGILYFFLASMFLAFFGGAIGAFSETLAVGFIGIGYIGVTVALVILTKNRMNDMNHSGWWMLVPLVSIIALFIPGKDENNAWGPRKP